MPLLATPMKVCTIISVVHLQRIVEMTSSVSMLVISTQALQYLVSLPYFLLDSLGVFAIKNLLHSNMSSVLSTSYDAVDTILDQRLPTSDAGGHNVSVYLLDSSGFVVWTSNADQLQVGGQQFAKLHPLVFEDMVNNSVFIRKLFMGHEPKPCGIYTMPHFITAACLDSAATSVHKVCLLNTQESS